MKRRDFLELSSSAVLLALPAQELLEQETARMAASRLETKVNGTRTY